MEFLKQTQSSTFQPFWRFPLGCLQMWLHPGPRHQARGGRTEAVEEMRRKGTCGFRPLGMYWWTLPRKWLVWGELQGTQDPSVHPSVHRTGQCGAGFQTAAATGHSEKGDINEQAICMSVLGTTVTGWSTQGWLLGEWNSCPLAPWTVPAVLPDGRRLQGSS